jgi:hypothetical protein
MIVDNLGSRGETSAEIDAKIQELMEKPFAEIDLKIQELTGPRQDYSTTNGLSRYRGHVALNRRLMDGLRSKDEDAASTLFRLWFAPLRTHLMNRGASEQLALDIIQDMWLAIWAKRHKRLDPTGNFLGLVARAGRQNAYRSHPKERRPAEAQGGRHPTADPTAGEPAG